MLNITLSACQAANKSTSQRRPLVASILTHRCKHGACRAPGRKPLGKSKGHTGHVAKSRSFANPPIRNPELGLLDPSPQVLRSLETRERRKENQNRRHRGHEKHTCLDPQTSKSRHQNVAGNKLQARKLQASKQASRQAGKQASKQGKN